MDGKVGYSFQSLMLHHKRLLAERDDIVNNLGLPIVRSGVVINSLVEDLKIASKKIEDFERKVLWTENIND